MQFVIFASFLLLATRTAALPECSDPSLWCQTTTIATTCNVLEQCRKHIWPHTKLVVDNSPVVNLTLYYEVLCPDCRQFVSGQLNSALNSISEIINLTLIPYGNARQTFDNKTNSWEFKCQHGEMECWGNALQSCVIYEYPDVRRHYEFIYCMESAKSNRHEDIHSVAKDCAEKLQMEIDQILKCVESPLGKSLQHKMAVKTESLLPPHKYVPWVTVNDVHTEDIQNRAMNDLVKLICDSYHFDSRKPDACL